MPRLKYITTVQIPAENAQSIQIYNMAASLSKLTTFELVTPMNALNVTLSETPFNWKKIRSSSSSKFIKTFYLIADSFGQIDKKQTIYTRDIFIAFLFRLRGFKVCYEVHKPFETLAGNFLFKLIKDQLLLVAISESLKEFVLHKYNLNQEKILVAHDGVDIQLFDLVKETKLELRSKLELKSERFIAMYTGSLYPGRGIEIVVACARALPQIDFIIVGGKPEDLKYLNLDRLPTNLIHMPRQPWQNIPKILKAADLLLMPYTKATSTYQVMSPLKMFEYLASGVPILSSDIGNIREVLNDSVAYFFNPESSTNAAECISAIIKEPDIAKSKAEAALKLVRENYSWDIRAQRIVDFLDCKS